jgi:hypothetical protein
LVLSEIRGRATARRAGPGEESGARGLATTPYYNDPNKHLLEIRTYER